ncbi:RagB/SusD family nutrient uptake outer membrane protein [Chitinophaga rhizophila]|uniref:RagB/SusD family nutrient uptake outer membrane protein n=1 Tax=Chitinophaga rhizophila TaxID=2866212 RepID=A0ABS7GFI8_9BACT|nr:RagB/SusD family nutrient uptake outer membrane protein [Chitinophaga rhizophila]MBW8685574.1 RagB/SusD family nutrient uptake outer membrane protein [Chitinophaga rhizophila]
MTFITLFGKIFRLLFICWLVISISSCKKLIEVDPPINEIIGSEIYSSNTTAISVLTGIYTSMSSNGIFNGEQSVSIRPGLSADELIPVINASSILTLIYHNSLTNNGDQLYWSELYAYLYRINSAIEGISASVALTTDVKKRLLAEAKFLRAFMYFYLVNFYGSVPLLLSTDKNINVIAPREPMVNLYAQMINDLKEAQGDLSDQYLNADLITNTSERIRPNKFAVSALLARVYLYNQNWALAEQEASKVIDNTAMYMLENPKNVFLKGSREAIWQLQPVNLNQNTIDAEVLVLAPTELNPRGGPTESRPFYLSQSLLKNYSFEDQRRVNWIDSVVSDGIVYYYPFKYKAYLPQERTEYLTVLRLAEQYLIRAEARAQMNRIGGSNSAMDDINIIRTRAGLSDIVASSKEEVLDIILKERRKELFTEWGHRWFDLKRTGNVDMVMQKVAIDKGIVWNSYKALYPIPVQDIQRNPSLRGHQNPGYPER